MKNPYNPKRKRGTGKQTTFARSVERDAERMDVHNSTSHEVVNSAVYYEIADVDETTDGYLVPRRSLTSKQRLHYTQHALEGTILEGSLPERVDGKLTGRTIKTSDANRVKITARSPKTLLRSGLPVKPIQYDERGIGSETEYLRRQRSRSKRIGFDNDHTFTKEAKPTVTLPSKIKIDGLE